jgi:ABC-type transporter Mla subunit MlaD
VKRLLAGGLLVVALLLVLVLGTGAGGGGGGTYRVRAIFDNAGFLVPGEDVKVAGVKVGAIDSLDVTPDNKAAVILDITDPAFQDFKQDASCTVRLQSLIGEKFVACEPTQPRGANSPPPPSLRQIERGPGKGQYLLPVANTSSPVDVDLLNDIMRLPQRQRLAIIVNELGVGLAGNGQELSAAIRRADPALAQFDRVLKILASQNKVLADLATESDAALAPTAAQASSISDFIDKAGVTATATAAQGDALEQNFAKLPAFLQQLRPTAKALGTFAAAGTPVFRDLGAVAPSINRLIEQLGPFSQAALPTFKTLGDLADTGSKALPAAQPVIQDLATFGAAAKPLASELAKGLTSVQQQHGIQRLLDIILFTAGSANGFDTVNHYLRSYLVVPGQCLQYVTKQTDFSCPATFNQLGGSGSSSAATAATSSAASGSDAAPTGSAPAVVQMPKVSLPSSSQTAPPGGSAAQGSAETGVLSYLLGGGSAR